MRPRPPKRPFLCCGRSHHHMKPLCSRRSLRESTDAANHMSAADAACIDANAAAATCTGADAGGTGTDAACTE